MGGKKGEKNYRKYPCISIAGKDVKEIIGDADEVLVTFDKLSRKITIEGW